jgi:hypothetical protein
MKKDLKSTALVWKLEQDDCRELARVEGGPPAGWSPPEKPRRTLQEIMWDFAQDMHDEARQMVFDGTGNEPSPDEYHTEAVRLMRANYDVNRDYHNRDWSIKAFAFMLNSAELWKAIFARKRNAYRAVPRAAAEGQEPAPPGRRCAAGCAIRGAARVAQ